MSKSGNGNPFGAAYTADAVNVRAEANFKVFQDQVFSVSKRFPLVKSGVANVIFDPTAYSGIISFLPISLMASLGGPIYVDLYVGTVVTPATGTILDSINRNFNSIVTADSVMILNPTITNDGTKAPSEFMIPSNGTAAITKAGGQAREDLIININTATKYMFRFTNIDTVTDSIIQLSATWFELPGLP